MGETRNQRRSRRRRETRGERELQRFNRILAMCENAPTLVFSYWMGPIMHGYIYNDNRFPNGAHIHTGAIIFNKAMTLTADPNMKVWLVKSERTTYQVKRMSPRWEEVGAGDQLTGLSTNYGQRWFLRHCFCAQEKELASRTRCCDCSSMYI